MAFNRVYNRAFTKNFRFHVEFFSKIEEYEMTFLGKKEAAESNGAILSSPLLAVQIIADCRQNRAGVTSAGNARSDKRHVAPARYGQWPEAAFLPNLVLVLSSFRRLF